MYLAHLWAIPAGYKYKLTRLSFLPKQLRVTRNKETFSLVQRSSSPWVSLHLVPSAPFTLCQVLVLPILQFWDVSSRSAAATFPQTPPKSSQTLTFTSHPRSITCVQPFKNKALRPPQPLTSAWMPSLVTWSHQEMFNCSNSGHPSLRIKQNKTNVLWPPLPLRCSHGTVSLGRELEIQFTNKPKTQTVFQVQTGNGNEVTCLSLQ